MLARPLGGTERGPSVGGPTLREIVGFLGDGGVEGVEALA